MTFPKIRVKLAGIIFTNVLLVVISGLLLNYFSGLSSDIKTIQDSNVEFQQKQSVQLARLMNDMDWVKGQLGGIYTAKEAEAAHASIRKRLDIIEASQKDYHQRVRKLERRHDKSTTDSR